jgi:hypothetical protein
VLELWSMNRDCPVCIRALGKAYHGKKIKKKFCCRKCEGYFKKHRCTMWRGQSVRNACQNEIFKSSKKFCSTPCKDEYFNKGKKIAEHLKCSKCNSTKKFFEFRYRNIGRKDPIGLYRQSYCRDCENQILKDKRDEAPEHRLYLLARSRAKRDNLPFDLTEDYINLIWPKDNKCPILKTTFKSGIANKYQLPSIDKVVPKKGYTKGNVAIISYRANSLKSDVKDIRIFKNMYKFYKNFD